jgi:hypothetical protein
MLLGLWRTQRKRIASAINCNQLHDYAPRSSPRSNGKFAGQVLIAHKPATRASYDGVIVPEKSIPLLPVPRVATHGVDACENDNASGIVLHADFMARSTKPPRQPHDLRPGETDVRQVDRLRVDHNAVLENLEIVGRHRSICAVQHGKGTEAVTKPLHMPSGVRSAFCPLCKDRPPRSTEVYDGTGTPWRRTGLSEAPNDHRWRSFM